MLTEIFFGHTRTLTHTHVPLATKTQISLQYELKLLSQIKTGTCLNTYLKQYLKLFL